MASGLSNVAETSLPPCTATVSRRAPAVMGDLRFGKKNSILGSERYALAATMSRDRVSRCTAEATFLFGSTGS